MNKHLEPIFSTVIPEIEKAGVGYWVYGGIGIAGIKGFFYRKHQDVDIFVLDKDYKKVTEIIGIISGLNSWRINHSVLKDIRPKTELFIKGRERLSLIPIYERGNEVEFIFENGSRKFSKKLLEPVIRDVEISRIPTPSEDIMKELLRFYLKFFLKSKKWKIKELWDKRKQDAEQLLGNKEAKKFFTEELFHSVSDKSMKGEN